MVVASVSEGERSLALILARTLWDALNIAECRHVIQPAWTCQINIVYFLFLLSIFFIP